MQPLRVTVWNENFHEQTDEPVRLLYPEGMHGAIAKGLSVDAGLQIRTATFDDPEHGLTEDVLKETDVLLWWGHRKHEAVSDAVVERVVRRVWDGMGFLALHSAHISKPFRRLMGTPCMLNWRVADENERVWVVNPAHPIAAGIDQCIEIEKSEMYSEPFGVPEPDESVFISWFKGGEVFRSGCCWRRGLGKIFYFGPGHQTYPIYHHPGVHQVLRNAVRWATPSEAPPIVWARVPPEQARESFAGK